jgi:hypothetical protein
MLLLLAALLAPQDTALQKVVAVIGAAAKENAAKAEKERLAGDALADLYVRRACASGEPAKSVIYALAYALDPTDILARNPLSGDTFKNAETADARKARAAAMGKPTLRGREDWLIHFAVSAGLALLVGEQTAESLGIQKEVADAKGKEKGAGSGFSFTDLNADVAGIAFAEWLVGEKSKEAMETCGKRFEGAQFLPEPKGLADDLTWTEFEKAWIGVKDAKFRDECQRLRARVQGCKGYEAK